MMKNDDRLGSLQTMVTVVPDSQLESMARVKRVMVNALETECIADMMAPFLSFREYLIATTFTLLFILYEKEHGECLIDREIAIRSNLDKGARTERPLTDNEILAERIKSGAVKGYRIE